MGSEEVALAAEVFDQFCSANSLKSILGHFRHLCTLIHLQPTHFTHFYPKLKSKLRSWKAQALWNKFDKRASHKCYNRGKACSASRVLVIGAGPCGLRAAIEAQLLGAKVVVIEKRDRLSRNNVLHLWPFVIHDLRGLGAKKFFGRFCAGAIDHISIRQLQCILLKVALMFGVEIHEGVSFENLQRPPEEQDKERMGWRAAVEPKDHPVSQYEFDVLIGADGKRNTLDGFKRKEFRGKLAIAITANFINKHSMAEARVEEISGVAFIFNQKFFKELYASTGIDLENIVYYKDETHYFVMTAKKHSLIDKGVILNDYAETARLLAIENVDKDALMEYAREAADFSTGYQLPHLEFALNHYGQPDVAMFDFTSMYAAENASRVMEAHGHRLLVMLVGDSLLEPFWPTGSGCARGFLSSMDACWAVRSWAQGLHPLQVLAERESVYRLLGQTTPENLHRDLNSYTLDPHTRYPNLNTSAVLPVQVRGLLNSDDTASIEQFLKAPSLHQELPKKKRRRGLDGDAVLGWVRRQTEGYPGIKVEGVACLRDGLALCALIHHYRPHLLDFDALDKEDIAANNQLAFDILERELAIPPVMTGEEMVGTEVPDKLTIISYLSQVYDAFRGEIPHIKHPKLEESEVADVRTRVVGMSPAQRQALLSKLAKTTRRSRKSDLDGEVEVVEAVNWVEKSRELMEEEMSPYEKRIKALEEEREKRRLDQVEDRKMRIEKWENRLRERTEEERRRRRAEKTAKWENRLRETEEEEADDEERRRRRTERVSRWENRLRDLDVDGEEERRRRRAEEDRQRRRLLEEMERRRLVEEVESRNRLQRLASWESRDSDPDEEDEDEVEYARRRKRLEREKERREVVEDIEQNRSERMMRRRWLRHLATQQFHKSMQMLQSNDRPTTDGPFEDYSLFLYRQTAPDFKDRVKQLESKLLYPDRDSRGGDDLRKGGGGKDFSGRVKDLEAKLRGQAQDKKPKDLLRAIGKIEKTDWNVKEIEKKIEENRMGKGGSKQKAEKVPKWSKEQFEDKFSAVEKKLKGRQSDNNKYAEIDLRLEKLEKKMREGGGVEPGKVSAMAAHLATVHTEPPPPAVHKTSNGGVVMAVASEVCHFCGKRVYLMERLSAEGKFFHRGCFKCHYCSTTLRLGNYLFDREGKYGSRFFCMQHFGMEGAGGKRIRQTDKQPPPEPPPPLPLDEGDMTPERIEFENLSDCVEVEEDEWTDTNFAASDSSDLSESSSESEDGAFAEALEEGLNAEETLRLARDWTRLYGDSDDTHPSYHESDEDESETATEGEDDVKARELRKKEVPKETSARKPNSDTGSETEVASDDYSSSCSEESEPEDNSATEISTDSEFEHDGTPHHIPDIIITDVVQVKRGQLEQPKKVQLVATHQLNGNVQRPSNDVKPQAVEVKPSLNTINNNEESNEKVRPSIFDRRGGDYLLNRTQSTEGIASKISLELKKKYLLGPDGGSGAVRKSGSASTLDSKFKSLIDQISEQQKLLNPAPEPSATMQAILQGADKIRSSPSALLKKQLPPGQPFRHICALGQKEEPQPLPQAQAQPQPQPQAQPPPVKKTEEEDFRPRSPVHETSIVVPEFPRNEEKEADMESDSLSSDESTSSEESEEVEAIVPKLEIHNSRGELMEEQAEVGKTGEVEKEEEVVEVVVSVAMAKPEEEEVKEDAEGQSEQERSWGEVTRAVGNSWSEGARTEGGWGMVVVPGEESSVLLKQVTTPAELFVSEDTESPPSTPSLRDDSESLKNETAGLTETELSDWAREEDTMVSDTLDDLEIDPQYVTFRKHRVPRSRRPARGVAARIARGEDFEEEVPHVCGKGVLEELERLEWADTGGEEESPEDPPPNSGYVRFVDTPDDPPTPVAPPDTDTTTSEPTTVKNSPVDPKPNDYQEYVQRLRGRISPFADVRDSIDVRKSRKKFDVSPVETPKTPTTPLSVSLVTTPPTTQQKLEQISKERAIQKDLIHEMVLNKVLSERGRSKRAGSRSPLASSASLSCIASPPPPDKPLQEPKSSLRPKSVFVEPLVTPLRQRSCTVSNALCTKKGATPGYSLPDLSSPHLRNQLRESARARVRMMSDEDLGLSPEEKLRRLRDKLNIPSKVDDDKKKGRNGGGSGKEERKRSIIQAVQDFFKKSPSPPKTPFSQSPTKLFKFTKTKDKGGGVVMSEVDGGGSGELSGGPPVPPLPQAYTPTQEDSLSEEDSKATTEERSSKRQRRLAKQAQRKRLRMAQEMQRQLEELEVKQRELEAQGVHLEKALRGEQPDGGKEDEELLREWFELVRQRTDVRRYENELMVRAQELELDDRHSRLQQQLKALLANNEGAKEVALEGRILREMLEIVERRSALSAQLESERQRYQEEDKDLEAQMLAKGLRLTPLRKTH